MTDSDVSFCSTRSSSFEIEGILRDIKLNTSLKTAEHGKLINLQRKTSSISFRDEKEGSTLAEIIFVESYKKYNTDCSEGRCECHIF